MHRGWKRPVLEAKRPKATYDGGAGGRESLLPSARTENGFLPGLKDSPVFSCKACYSLCDRGSKSASQRKTNPVLLPRLGASSGTAWDHRKRNKQLSKGGGGK